MKKLLFYLSLLLITLVAAQSFAAGSCTQSAKHYGGKDSIVVTFICTGDSSNGSIPNTAISAATMAEIKTDAHYLYNVIAYPTSGGTAPDAADVSVLMGGTDLLGAKGVNLIHATLKQDTFPYSTFMTSYRFPVITDTVTLSVANQATNSANFTIEMDFEK